MSRINLFLQSIGSKGYQPRTFGVAEGLNESNGAVGADLSLYESGAINFVGTYFSVFSYTPPLMGKIKDRNRQS
jgi:hypothetical protein